MIDAYLDHLRVERRLAAHTLESYARDLAALQAFAAGAGRAVDTLDRRALELFVREQMTQGLSPRSVTRTVAAVRGLPLLVIGGSTAAPPTTCGRRALPALPKCLSLEEVDTLIAQPDVSTRLGLRDRAMIELRTRQGSRQRTVGVRRRTCLDERY
jgi:integrase/recombinase XerC